MLQRDAEAQQRSIARRCGSLGAMLNGKTGIVFGVANKRSIAWAIAQALAGAGMRLVFTYQGERLMENVEELTATLPGSVLYPCDVGVDAEITAVFAGVERDLGRAREHAGGPWHPRLHRHAQAPRREGPAAAQRGAARGRRHRAVPGFADGLGDHRRGDPRRLRLLHHGRLIGRTCRRPAPERALC
jgi:NAD(P)-dependent dehydrogenase (short-subunit alcohol dehydrogenase family)